MPPASYTPCLTLSATSLRCELHGLRSEAVFAMAMCGRRPSNACEGSPRRIQARCRYVLRSAPPYHCELRRSFMKEPISFVGWIRGA